MFQQTTIDGDHNIGLYGFATDRYCCVGASHKTLEKTLQVKLHVGSVFGTPFVGMFCTGNSAGMMAARMAQEYTEGLGVDHALFLDTEFTALGNLVVMNDHGIVVSPLLRRHANAIEAFFGVPVAVSRIGGSSLAGSVCVATNKGCLWHPRARDHEIALLEKTLTVAVAVGTVSFGSPFVKAGLLVNSKGFVVSPSTTGIEMGRITEALGFLEGRQHS